MIAYTASNLIGALLIILVFIFGGWLVARFSGSALSHRVHVDRLQAFYVLGNILVASAVLSPPQVCVTALCLLVAVDTAFIITLYVLVGNYKGGNNE